MYDIAKYPEETIADGGGDCEDTSILFVSLARIAGFDAKFLKIPGHMMAVIVGNFTGYYIKRTDKKYFTVETAREFRIIGEIYTQVGDMLNNNNIYISEKNQLIPVKVEWSWNNN